MNELLAILLVILIAGGPYAALAAALINLGVWTVRAAAFGARAARRVARFLRKKRQARREKKLAQKDEPKDEKNEDAPRD
ncbi:MAG: hypothetical protein QNJ16_15835 [Rhodobacter sp.]|nr:hypothetical protein [Rhodobacter sp.]